MFGELTLTATIIQCNVVHAVSMEDFKLLMAGNREPASRTTVVQLNAKTYFPQGSGLEITPVPMLLGISITTPWKVMACLTRIRCNGSRRWR